MILLTGFKMEDTSREQNKMIWKYKHIADSELSVILMRIPSNYEKF